MRLWEPDRYWRSLTSDGRVWAESSDETEVRESLDKIEGGTLQRSWRTVQRFEWRDAGPAPAVPVGVPASCPICEGALPSQLASQPIWDEHQRHRTNAPVGVQPTDKAELERLRNGIVLLTASFEVKCHNRQAASLRALLDPVGVQPEPAEGAHTWVESTGDWRPDGLGQIRPAVPVVHPEPGDREERWADALVGEYSHFDRDAAVVVNAHGIAAFLGALADVEVAAAVAAVRAEAERVRADDLAALRTMSDLYREAVGVPPSKHQAARMEAMALRVEEAEAGLAAVRADLAAQVEALRSPMPGSAGKLQDRVIGQHVGIAEAAALIRGRS